MGGEFEKALAGEADVEEAAEGAEIFVCDVLFIEVLHGAEDVGDGIHARNLTDDFAVGIKRGRV